MMMGQGPTSMVNAASTAAYMNRQAIIDGESIWPNIFGGGSGGGGQSGAYAPTGRGFMENLGGVFTNPNEAEATKIWAQKGAGGSSAPQGSQGSSSPAGVGGQPGSGASGSAGEGPMVPGAAARQTHAQKSMAQGLDTSQESSDYAEGEADKLKPITADRDKYTMRGQGAVFTSKENYATILPSLNVMDRLDNAFRGFNDLGQGFMLMFRRGEGRNIGSGLGKLVAGVGKLALSFIPLSPFLPVRMLGRMLTSVSPSHLPGFMQPYTVWMGRKMMGLGFRQIASRGKWSTQMGYYKARHAALARELATLEGAAGGVITAGENPKADGIRAEMSGIEDRVVGVMDNMGFGFSPLASVLPENPGDFHAYQGHMNSLRDSRDWQQKSKDPSLKHNLYDAYLRKSRHSDLDVAGKPRDPLMGGVEKGWTAFQAGKLADPDARKDFNESVTQAVSHFKDTGLAAWASEYQAARTPAQREQVNEKYRTKLGEFQRQLYSVGYLRSLGVKDTAGQKLILDANMTESGELFSWVGGKLTRRRMMKLPGKFGEAARKMEYVYQTDYYQTLLREGVSEEVALEKSRAMNLRLDQDAGGAIYMSGYDMRYLTSMMERDDWAMNAVRGAGVVLGKPRLTRTRTAPGESRNVRVTEAMAITVSEAEKSGSVAIYTPSRRGKPPEPLIRYGDSMFLHDGNQMLIVREEHEVGSAGLMDMSVKGGRAVVGAELEVLKAQITAGTADLTRYMVEDPDVKSGGRMREIVSAHLDSRGNVNFWIDADWRHHGEVDSGGAVPGQTYLCSPLLAGRDAMVALKYGLPGRLEAMNMGREELAGALIEIDPSLAGSVGGMSQKELRKKFIQIFDDKANQFKKYEEDEARRYRSKTNIDAAAGLELLGLGKADELLKSIESSDLQFHVSERESTLLKDLGLSPVHLQAVKGLVSKQARESGVTVHSVTLYSDPTEINPMMRSGDRGGTHLYVNLAHMAAENPGQYLKRAAAHYLPHELAGHTFADENVGRIMEAVKPDGRLNDRYLERASKEMISDQFVKEDKSLGILYGSVLEQLQGMRHIGLGDLFNAGRISAIAEKRGGLEAMIAKRKSDGTFEEDSKGNVIMVKVNVHDELERTVMSKVKGYDAAAGKHTGEYNQYALAKAHFDEMQEFLDKDPQLATGKANIAPAPVTDPGYVPISKRQIIGFFESNFSQSQLRRVMMGAPSMVGATGAGSQGAAGEADVGGRLHDRGHASPALERAKASGHYDAAAVAGVRRLMRMRKEGQMPASKTLAVDFGAVGLGEGAGRHLIGPEKEAVAVRIAEHMVKTGQMTKDEAEEFKKAVGDVENLNLVNKSRTSWDARHIIRHEKLHAEYEGREAELRGQWANMDPNHKTEIEAWYRKNWVVAGEVDGAQALTEYGIEKTLSVEAGKQLVEDAMPDAVKRAVEAETRKRQRAAEETKTIYKPITTAEVAKITADTRARYERAAQQVFDPLLQQHVDDAASLLGGSGEAREKLKRHINSHALEQQVDNPEQYVSHGFDHSINVKKYIDEVGKNNPELLKAIKDKYKLTDEQAKGMLGLVAIYHDFGYPEVGPLGKALHAVTGAKIADSQEFKQILRDNLGNLSESDLQAVQRDFRDAILFHSADKVETYYDAKIQITHGEFLAGAHAEGRSEADRAKDVVTVVSEFKRRAQADIEAGKTEKEEPIRIICSEDAKKQILAALEEKKENAEGIVFETPEASGTKFKGRKVDLKGEKDGLLGLEFQEVDAKEQPFTFAIRVADNMDMTEKRFSELQRSEPFKQIYRAFAGTDDNPRGNILAQMEQVERLDKECGKLKKDGKPEDAAKKGEEAQKLLDGIISDEGNRAVIEHYSGLDFSERVGADAITHVISQYKKGIVEEIMTPEAVEGLEKRGIDPAMVKDFGRRQNSESIRHFGGCEPVKDVQLKGDTLTISVDRAKYEEYNQKVVTEKRSYKDGTSGDIDVGLGGYQVWRAYEANRSNRVGGKTIKIRVVDAADPTKELPLSFETVDDRT
ncbi:MAG: hypothetical protein V1875_05750 [Candidatus Altiarchaeota archaeon]